MIDRAAPSESFQGGLSAMALGAGWYTPETNAPEAPEPIYFAWVQGTSADVVFERPPADELDFYAECRPIRYPGAPVQTLTLRLNDSEVTRVQLVPEWQQLRAPLPASDLAPGRNTLSLSFSHAARPIDVQEGTLDKRELSAEFQRLAVLPRSAADAALYIEQTRVDPATRGMNLAPGGIIEFPLPPTSRITLRLGKVLGAARDSVLLAHLIDPNGADEELFSGEANRTSMLRLSFDTAVRGVSRLRFTHRSSAVDGAGSVHIAMPSDFLVANRSPTGTAKLPHVFIYLIDTLRADDVVVDDQSSDASPHIASFADQSVVFANTWTPSSWTLPATVSLLTGTYSFRHGIMKGNVKYSGSEPTPLQTFLDKQGYATVAISQSFITSERFGLDVGFEEFFFDDHLNSWLLGSHKARAVLLRWLDDKIGGPDPLFAFLHSVDPHAPYNPPAKFRKIADEHPGKLGPREYRPALFTTKGHGEDPAEVAHMHALYSGEIQYADYQFGRFVQMLQYFGLYDDSLVILVSDHGEEFAEHGGFDHGRTLYEELLRVPLIVKFPRARWAGTAIDRRVNLVDVVPTVLDFVGVEPGGLSFDGMSLIPLLEGDDDHGADRAVFSEIAPLANEIAAAVDLRAIAVGDLKCIESLNQIDQFGNEIPRRLAFDLSADPGEQRALSESSRQAEVCRSLLSSWGADADNSRSVTSNGLVPTDEDTLEQLRALGYAK